MKPFFERLKINIAHDPDRAVLRSESFPEGITYKQLDEASGRVCRYLRDMGIGREDFVMILMPREASAYISVIGVWKSGAAMIMLEEDYSPERVSFIKADMNCKLVITRDVFDEMMKTTPCDDYDIPGLHDACYATYTSGSTGRPKGILHEFGKLDTFDYDYDNKLLPLEDDGRFAIVTPLNFGPSIRNAVTALLYGKCLYIVPRNIVKNPKLLYEYFNDNKISETSVTCSFFKAYSFASKYMKNVFVHSEPCIGVFGNGVNVINLYTLSEVVFPIYTFRIEKPYDKAPLGYANKNVKVKIVNENGIKAKPYEVGEIIVEDEFTRGYINLPEKTAEAFSDGYFHSGDLGYSDENGMVFLRGRKDDMIKINGNRIEPMEIEANVKKLLRVKNALAKGFVDRRRSFIAVYLLRDELCENNLLNDNGGLIFSVSEMNRKLQSMLPDYMIPLYYTVLDAYPKNANGKISRKELPKPDAQDYLKSYEPPENDAEAYFCRLFEKVLKLDKVGVNDDFYQIGGDSMSSIMAIAECDRFELSIADIYNGRTPRALSRLVPKLTENGDQQIQNEQALLTPQPLLPEQQTIFEWQMEFPDYILNNLTRFFRLNKDTDIDRFKAAVDKVLRHHPVFSSVLVDDKGVEKLCWRPELFKETEIITVSRTELQGIMDEPCRPFQMENSLLYRHAIYKCDDTAYFSLEIHHLITDGTSLKMLFDQILKCYYDEDVSLPPDDLFLLLRSSGEKAKYRDITPRAIRELNQFNGFMLREDNSVRVDHFFDGLMPSKYTWELNLKKDKILKDVNYQEYKGNVFFLTCFLKTMADYNKRSKAFSFWTYSGRARKAEQNAHGMLIRSMPMGIEFDDPTSGIKDSLDYVKNEVRRQIAAEVSCIDGITDEFMISPYFIYQKDMLFSKHFNGVFEEEISLKSGCMAFEFHLIDNTDEDYFRCVVKYSAGFYEKKSIATFCELFEAAVKQVIDENQ